MIVPPEDDEFRVHWFSLALRHLCTDGTPDEPASVVRLGDLSDGCDVIADHGRIDVRPCSTDRRPDATITAPPQVFVALFAGAVPLPTAMAMGLAVDGSVAALERVLPGRTDG
jgi:hypothetical protein